MRELRIISACLFVALAAISAAGQANSAAPTHLALEVYISSGGSPSYISVPQSGAPPHWTWYTRFKRAPNQTGPEGLRAVKAVNVRVINAGDRVMASVSVFIGERFEEEKLVADYALQEGEKVTLRELSAFGIEPFDVKLVRVAVDPADLPQVISKAPSIELVTIQSTFSTLPGYRLTLRNLSPKSVMASMIKVREGKRIVKTGMPQGEEGKPLIVASGMSEIVLSAPIRADGTTGAYQPVAVANQTIEITTAAFEDGSSEGDPSHASNYRDVVNIRRVQLRKVIDLFEERLQSDLSDSASAIKIFEDKVAVISSAGGIRMNVMDEIRRFRLNNSNPDAKSYRAWLLASKERYKAWLARL
jgi:hypothetical protein